MPTIAASENMSKQPRKILKSPNTPAKRLLMQNTREAMPNIREISMLPASVIEIMNTKSAARGV